MKWKNVGTIYISLIVKIEIFLSSVYLERGFTFKNLLDIGLNINQKDNDGKTPLFHCNYFKAFELLLTHGADINSVDKYGKNLLFYDHPKQILEEILKSNIDFNLTDNTGLSFLSYELFAKYPSMIMNSRDKISIKDVIIHKIYLNTHNGLESLIKHSFNLIFPSKVEFNYDPYQNLEELKQTLIILNNLLSNKSSQTRFHFKRTENNSTRYILWQVYRE
jgi:ankyrin repeat protein